jgi:UDP-GlcNAc:undecaprenyl-phosphate GlcNAc-1-phosphate transferase
VVIGLPVFDALWVMTRRVLHKTSPFAPDKGHVHHKFLDLGFEHRFTVLVIFAVSLFWASSAVLLRNLPEYVLLLFLPGTALCGYLFLRHLLNHRDRYAFLTRDNEGEIRNTVTFNRCADLIDRVLPLLSVVLVLYVALGAVAVMASGVKVPLVALLLLVVGVGLRLKGRDSGEFQMLLVYACACLLAFVVWRRGEELLLGLSPKRLGDALLLAAALLVGLKLLFRRVGEFFLGSADFLALALMIFLAIAAQQPQLLGVSLGGPLMRAILLMLAARTIGSRGPASRRVLINGALGVLAIFALAGLR